MSDIEQLTKKALTEIQTAANMETLEAQRIALLGKSGSITGLLKQLGNLPPEQRKAFGEYVNRAKEAVSEAIAARKSALEDLALATRLSTETIDVTLPGRGDGVGNLHPVSRTLERITDIFARLGYQLADGPEIEDDWHNFQALNIPPDHPARTMKDSLYVSVPGHPELLLRTETSAVQIRTMQSQPPPVYIVAPGRVFRRETPDATHSPVFHQLEGLVVDEGITFAHLKGTLEAAVKALFGETRRVRLGPAFFPFVEPGCEVGVSCFKCDGAGCNVCGSGWIELLGAGMVHPQVLENCGYDSERYTGFAFGMGIDRVALLKYEIPDIRMLFDGDVRFLAQFEGVA